MSDERLECILEELVGIEWDILVLVETWREQRSEYFSFPSGHRWYGSGGTKRRCGVGFLVNNRCTASCAFSSVNERLASLTVKSSTMRFKLFGVYFPDSSHPDLVVDVMYEQLDL